MQLSYQPRRSAAISSMLQNHNNLPVSCGLTDSTRVLYNILDYLMACLENLCTSIWVYYTQHLNNDARCCSVSEGNGHSHAAHRTSWLCSPPTLWHLPLPPSHSHRSSSPAQASTDSIFPAFHTYKSQILILLILCLIKYLIIAKYWACFELYI